MHEYGLAQDIVERLKAEMKRADARCIVAADIEVGGLSHTSTDHLAFWVEEVLRQEQGGDVTVRVVRTSPSLTCGDCQQDLRGSLPEEEEWEAYSLPAVCPHCGSTRVQPRGDTGCVIHHVELEC
jgi:Zn finger protein HypA/HybF involved in hydrogenase expression